MSTEIVEVEATPIESSNQLAVIVKDSGLDATKADYILKNFQDYFKIAAEWEIKAKGIVVRDASQNAEMQMARAGRLFLREKRIAIEKSRKELKEQALREGKAIDGIANVLKALIVPIEEYLDEQEHYVENKAKEEAARIAAEMERKAEEERIAREKAEAEARRAEEERIRKENERLQAEAEKARKEKEAAEAQARKEREAAEKAAREAEAKAAAERKAIEEKARKEREEAERIAADERKNALAEKAKADELRLKMESLIECPNCHHKFSIQGNKI